MQPDIPYPSSASAVVVGVPADIGLGEGNTFAVAGRSLAGAVGHSCLVEARRLVVGIAAADCRSNLDSTFSRSRSRNLICASRSRFLQG